MDESMPSETRQRPGERLVGTVRMSLRESGVVGFIGLDENVVAVDHDGQIGGVRVRSSPRAFARPILPMVFLGESELWRKPRPRPPL